MTNFGFEPHQPVDAEQFFTEFVRQSGGQVIAEHLVDPPKFQNADFYFPDNQVVAELKCFQKDFPIDQNYQDKYLEILKKGLTEEQVTLSMIFGKDRFPPIIVEQYNRLFRTPIQKILEKGNKQLKQTKEKLYSPDTPGLIILTNTKE